MLMVDVASLKAALGNQFLSGGLVLMIVGGIIAYCRPLPGRLWALIQRQCTVSIEIHERDTAHYWIMLWLEQQPYSRRARDLTVQTFHTSGGDAPTIIFTPAPGVHWFMHGGRPMVLRRTRQQRTNNGAPDSVNQPGAAPGESFRLTLLGRSQDRARALILEARRVVDALESKDARLYITVGGGWYQRGFVRDRPLASVILPGRLTEDLMADIHRFLGRAAWYQERGIPYRRSYLLEGERGSGKTSLAAAVACELKMPLYALSLGSVSSDDRLTEMLHHLPPRAVLLLDDIDAGIGKRLRHRNPPNLVSPGREEPQGSEQEAMYGVTLHGLLQALDGVDAGEGRITFITTNHAEQLDPALLRAGRVDKRFTFTKAAPDQIRRIVGRFYGPNVDPSPIVDALAGQVAMADVQELLIEHAESFAALEAAVCPAPSWKTVRNGIARECGVG